MREMTEEEMIKAGEMAEIVFKLKSTLTNTYAINDLEHKVKQHVSFELMRQKMIDSVLTNREKGIIEESAEGERYVVSLTTHGERIEKVFQAIESVFLQSRKANKVVLYLSEDELLMKELPITLEKQVERGLTIKYVKDFGPYTKLIPALHDFPDANIITVDDDQIYSFNMIDRLVRAHHTYPQAVCYNYARKIKLKDQNHFAPYLSFEHVFNSSYSTSPTYLALGYNGVLYPAHSLHPDVTNEELFRKLSPYADDIWYKAMELLQGTPVVALPRCKSWTDMIFEDLSMQETALILINIDQGKNDDQFKAVFDHYNLYHALTK